ncbi:hypothetical protein [Lysobacter claricitrinus]|uniref:hypothetical protein n=1 Tax=Lysobacter claricitrinus TaxID=3367728 RepID=UPI0037DACCF6
MTPDEKDFLTYLQSVSAPVMHEVCAPLYTSIAGTHEKIDAWAQQNADAIAHGREVQTARLQSGETIDTYEAGVRKHLKAMMVAAPMDKMSSQCVMFMLMATPRKVDAASPAPAAAAPAASPQS